MRKHSTSTRQIAPAQLAALSPLDTMIDDQHQRAQL
jgi:hypothetical protein